MSSDSSSLASHSDDVSLTSQPLTGLVPALGPTVDTEFFPSTFDHSRANMTILAPATPLVPKLLDELSDLCEKPSPPTNTPRGHPKMALTSTPKLTARALRALRRDTVRTTHENSLTTCLLYTSDAADD